MERTLRSETVKHQHNRKYALASVYDVEFLLKRCRWIRDELDPRIAREGPDILHPDDVSILDEFLCRLLTSNVSLDDIRYSRLHHALLSISGHATRWPKQLINRADDLRIVWEDAYGPLKTMGTPLYGPGGRLYRICEPDDVENDKLLIRWLKQPDLKLSPAMSRRTGDLGFNAGDWWISPAFAFRDGIIDFAGNGGGITFDSKGAYAILMTDNEELDSTAPDKFTYRTKTADPGRYRLTAATLESRLKIRVLRSHTLKSFWAPQAGVRYDGLHVVVGWKICTDPKTDRTNYDVVFERLDGELNMDKVMRRPRADELEDFKEFRQLRRIAREKLYGQGRT